MQAPDRTPTLPRSTHTATGFAPGAAGGKLFRKWDTALFHSIMLQDMRMGTIMLKYRMAHDYAWLWSFAKIICIVLISPGCGLN
jgi:hypothetical protein